ncbi:hypothetical protein KM043_016779 [Ampulex compressa]|nr:hypothetical protein KM043_016779 [Ampulex compressa]
MAYVLWRVFMKKYSKVRLGIRNLPVIPAERRVSEKDETWTLAPEQDSCAFLEEGNDGKPRAAQQADKLHSRVAVEGAPLDAPDNADTLPRTQETRKSKTKKVKSYLRKCKGALSKGDDGVSERKRQENCTSWYLEEVSTSTSNQQEPLEESAEKYTEVADERIGESHDLASLVPEEAELIDGTISALAPPEDGLPRLADRRSDSTSRSRLSLYEDARDSCAEQSEEKTPIKESAAMNDEALSLETLTVEDTNLNKCDSNDTLIADVSAVCATDFESRANVEEKRSEEMQEQSSEEEALAPTVLLSGNRGDVASLVRNLLGPIYGDGVINLLIRQARDILVCAYHGNLENFFRTYLSPAAALLAEVKSVAFEMDNLADMGQRHPRWKAERRESIPSSLVSAEFLKVGRQNRRILPNIVDALALSDERRTRR